MTRPVGIITPMEAEGQRLHGVLDVLRTKDIAGRRYLEAKLFGVDVVFVQCGVGKVSAAMATQALMDHYHPERIYHFGVAGAIASLPIGALVLASSCAHHDLPKGILRQWLGEKECFELDALMICEAKKALGDNVHVGQIVTGESFVEEEGRTKIRKRFSPLAVDMESAAIAHVASANQVKLLVLRSITDNDEESGEASFEANLDKATKICHDAFVQVFLEMEDCID